MTDPTDDEWSDYLAGLEEPDREDHIPDGHPPARPIETVWSPLL